MDDQGANGEGGDGVVYKVLAGIMCLCVMLTAAIVWVIGRVRNVEQEKTVAIIIGVSAMIAFLWVIFGRDRRLDRATKSNSPTI